MLTGDQLGHHNALMAGFMGQPRRAGDIANRIQPVNAGAAEFICNDMGAINFYARVFQAKPLDIADDAHG